jgi:hypothetical protein
MTYQPLDPTAVLTMPKTKRASAMIRLAKVEGGFTWAVDFQRHHGDHLGCGEPLGTWDGKPNRLAPSRQAAIDAACDRIRRGIDEPDINAWLNGLTHAQPDLFGEAA